jgi:hypothetical protein
MMFANVTSITVIFKLALISHLIITNSLDDVHQLCIVVSW